MKRVSQLHPDGCGIACVAMIAGVSYREARKKFRKDEAVGQTKQCQIWKAHLIRLPRGRYRKLEQDAILRTRTRKSDGDSHWIVWDAKCPSGNFCLKALAEIRHKLPNKRLSDTSFNFLI